MKVTVGSVFVTVHELIAKLQFWMKTCGISYAHFALTSDLIGIIMAELW